MPASVLLVDNFDSFTFNVKDYLEQCGAKVSVAGRNQISTDDFHRFDGIVFSPGPGNPQQMPDLMALVNASVQQKPTLGICLGFQAIAHYYGSEIVKGNPKHGKVSKVLKVHHRSLLDQTPSSFDVVRYHSLCVHQILAPLEVLLETENKEIMAFQHAVLPVAGVQFHPEAYLTDFGMTILTNWLNLC